MVEVGIKQAKVDLSQLFEKALTGEVVVITRNGKDRVQLVPCAIPAAPTGFGEWREKLKDLPADYWTNSQQGEEITRLFYQDAGDE